MLRPLAVIALFALVAAGCQEYAEPTLTPGQKKKVEAHLLSEAPTPQHPVGAIIEGQVKLIGYDVDKTKAKPGEKVNITYYIEVLAEKPEDNKIFVHFQGRRNDPKAWMNLDHHPIEGLQPLRKMKQGQIIKDVQSFKIREDFPAGPAKIYWGLWRGNYRLKVDNKDAETVKVDKEGRVVLATVQVEGKPGAAGDKPARRRLPMARAAMLTAGETITVDGKLDEPVWSRAIATAEWTSPDGKNRPAPKTTARFAWTPTHVYIGVESADDDVWSTFTERDSNTWEQEVIEVFIDADGDKKDYLELQVTPANVIFDAKFERHRSDLAKARAWNMEGFETAVVVDGTLNKRDDTDKGYVVEMAIPVAQVPGAKAPLAHGFTWRINLFRWDAPKDSRQQAAAFSPPIVGDFHALDRFGRLRFMDPALTQKMRRGKPLIQPRTLELDPKKATLRLPGNPAAPKLPKISAPGSDVPAKPATEPPKPTTP